MRNEPKNISGGKWPITPPRVLLGLWLIFSLLAVNVQADVVASAVKIGAYDQGNWYLDSNANGAWDPGADFYANFGAAGWTPVAGDWNGDGYKEIGVYVNTGTWYLDLNGNGAWDGEPIDRIVTTFGVEGDIPAASDIPVTGDWNGTGFAKIGYYRPSNFTWYLDYDGDFSYNPAVDVAQPFGVSNCIPVVGDWNGYGYDKIGVYFEGQWFLDTNGNFAWDGSPADTYVESFGASDILPVVGDWSGSIVDRVGGYRGGLWYLDLSGNGLWDGGADQQMGPFGIAGWQPVVGNWNTGVVNTRPVANAGPDQRLVSPRDPREVTLNGSGSTDGDSDPLTYNWLFTSKPVGSSATLSDATLASPTFAADTNGVYVLRLIVNDLKVYSAADTVSITAADNSAPVAHAGPDQNVSTRTRVTLNGSASTDVDGDPLTYSWSLVSKPAESSAALTSTTVVNPVFAADKPGDYIWQLIVNDGTVDSVADTVKVTTNSRPVANAGPAQNVATGTLVTLNGSGSSDADGDPLTYSWSLLSKPEGSSADLSADDVVSPTFTADLTGPYIIRLVVNDGNKASVAKTVTVTASIQPIADAGPDRSVDRGDLITLDGSGSTDEDGDPLTYSWSFTSRPPGSSAGLTGATTVNPSFTPDEKGNYVLQLIVNDGTVSSVADTTTVTALNNVPVANAGSDQNVNNTSLVTLNGSGSTDADSDPLTYSWAFTSKPVGSSAVLSSATVVSPTFTPDKKGEYVLSLIVNDGTVDSAADTITVTALNNAPVANAGLDQIVPIAALVNLSGSGSTDADSDPLTYTWTLTSVPVGSTAVLSSATAVNPTFTADLKGNYELSLVVNDGTVDSVADTITVIANTPPVADAGPDQAVLTTTLVTLTGSASSDADGDSLTYSWTLTSKPLDSTAVLIGADTVSPTFTADLAHTYVAQLVVYDGKEYSVADTVTITANTVPVANAGSNQSVGPGAIVTLNGSGSSDADGDDLAYSWSLTSKPVGSSAVLSSATAVSPTFTADIVGQYVVELVVNDGTVDSPPDTVTVVAASVLSDTGQTGDYTATFGEDSDYTIEPPSYTVNGDGTVTDNVTGLMWQRADDGVKRPWATAMSYCDNLVLPESGFSDWRLPSKKELMELVDYGRSVAPLINITAFPNANAAPLEYWTATQNALSNPTPNKWYVTLDSGYVLFMGQDKSAYVRCVRGGL